MKQKTSNNTSWSVAGGKDNGIEKLETYTLVKASDINKQRKKEERKKKLEERKQINGRDEKPNGKTEAQKRPRSEEADDSVHPKKAKKNERKKKKKSRGKEQKAKPASEVSVGPLLGGYKVQDDESEDLENPDVESTEVKEQQDDDGLCDDYDVPEHMELWQTLLVPKPIIKALDDMKFTIPTPIQMMTLPAAIHGHRDVIGAAETGSGKTLVFGIPILHGILNDREWDKKKNRSQENEEESDDESVASNDIGEDLQQKSDEYDGEEEADEHDEEEGDETDEDEGEEDEEQDGADEEDFEEQGIEDLGGEGDYHFDEDAHAGNIIDLGWCPASDEPLVKVQKKLKPLRALILTPTRELAMQVKNHLTALAKYTKTKIAVVIGGMASQKQERVLNQGPEIVVATPGRLWELIQEGNTHLSQIGNIRYLAIDETDRMLEKGHFQELQNLLRILNSDPIACKKRQTFILSATLTVVHSLPERLTQKGGKLKKPSVEMKLDNLISMVGVKPTAKRVDLTTENVTAQSLLETRIFCNLEDKDFYLYYFIQEHPGRTLVFCNSIDAVRRLTTILVLLKCNALPLHAELHQKQRLKNLERFTANKNGLLIATDVAARGLDIPDVENVIHYQVPRTSESYVHRSGRTARASKEGLSVVLVSPGEMSSYKNLLKTIKVKDLPVFPVNEAVMPTVKMRVNLARYIDKLEHRARKQQASNSWFKRAAEEAELEIDEDDGLIQDVGDSFEQANLKKEIKAKRSELGSYLSQPMIPKGYSARYITKAGPVSTPLSGTGNSQSAVQAAKNGKRSAKPVLKPNKRKFGGRQKKASK